MKNKLFLVLFILYSCIRSGNYEIEIKDETQFIINEEDLSINIGVNGFIDSVKYIILETTEDNIIGSVDKILFKNNKIYVLDKNISKALFIFNRYGHYLYKIDRQGRGPGEYEMINGFDLDNEFNIYIGDLVRKTILKFDSIGNFISEFKTDTYFEDFCIVNNNHLLIHNAYEKGVVQSVLGRYNLQTNKLQTILKSSNEFNVLKYPRYTPINFYRSDSILYYYPRFTNSVLRISNSDITIPIEFENSLIPSSGFLKAIENQIMEFQNSDILISVGDIYENNNFIILSAVKRIPINIIFSKKTFIKYNAVTFNSSIYLGNNRFYGTADDMFISIISPDLSPQNYIKRINNSKLNDSIKNVLAKVDALDNPILCLVKFSDI